MPSSLVIRNAVVIPIDPPNVVFDPGWIRIDGPRISALGGRDTEPGPADRVIDARGGLVLPGLVSVHQHVLDILLRGGVTTGTSFTDWLFGLYYGGISAYRPEDAGLATLVGAIETVRAGVTCVVDNWGVCSGDPVATIKASAEASLGSYRRAGLRVLFACMFATQLPDAWKNLPTHYDLARLCAPLDVAMGWIEDLRRDHHRRGDGRIQITAAPELPEMVGAPGLVAASQLAKSAGTVVATHLLASDPGRQWADAARLRDMGALEHHLLGAHCTAAHSADLQILAQHGVSVGHCPSANSALGRLVSAAPMLAAGLTVGLGNDNASLNRNPDIVAECRRAVMASRILGGPPEWIDTHKAVEMATIDGARAIGMDDQIGSLTPGKLADLIVVDTSDVHWWPRHDWLDTLVTQSKSTDVRTVVINGDVILDDRVLAFVDPEAERQLGRDAQRASQAILERARLT